MMPMADTAKRTVMKAAAFMAASAGSRRPVVYVLLSSSSVTDSCSTEEFTILRNDIEMRDGTKLFLQSIFGMVCIPCIIAPVLLFIWYRFIQPIVLKFWNPWEKKEIRMDAAGDARQDDSTK
ncbi:unnamed protein product, partial [Ixodes hexagonus]